MIYGLTHDADKRPIQRLAVNTRVAIGMKDPVKGYPKKIDYFMFTQKNAEGEWKESGDLKRRMLSKYGRSHTDAEGHQIVLPVREFEIILLSDDIEENFRTQLAWWTTTECVCHGDGMEGHRLASKVNDKELLAAHQGERSIPWNPCGDTCKDRIDRKCKPSGNLTFIMPDNPVIGSVVIFNTTSWKSIQNIHSSLTQIRSITGGRLRGIPLRMVMRPDRTRYRDKDGTTKTGNAFFVNIEFRADDYKTLIPSLIEQSVTYEQTVKALPAPKTSIVDETQDVEDEVPQLPEKEQAEIMGGEFYVDNDDSVPSSVAEAQEPTGGADIGTPESAKNAATMLGCAPAQVQALFGALKNWSHCADWMTAIQNEFTRLQITDDARTAIIQAGVARPAETLAELKANPDPKSEPATQKRQTAPRKPSAPATTKTEPDAPPAQSSLSNSLNF